MILSFIWLCLMAGAFLFAAAASNTGALSPAIMEGAQRAVTVCFSMAGPIILWSGFLRLLEDCGAAGKLEKTVGLPIRLLMPGLDGACLRSVCANVTANLLGLGNAATPAGLKAAAYMTSSQSLGLFMVLNSSSIQLIPATAAALRASLGSASPFDILPAVWLCSAVSLAAALGAMKLIPGGKK